MHTIYNLQRGSLYLQNGYIDNINIFENYNLLGIKMLTYYIIYIKFYSNLDFCLSKYFISVAV
jgi:hypothetical protein